MNNYISTIRFKICCQKCCTTEYLPCPSIGKTSFVYFYYLPEQTIANLKNSFNDKISINDGAIISIYCLFCNSTTFFTMLDIPLMQGRLNITLSGIEFINMAFLKDFENFMTFNVYKGEAKKIYIEHLPFILDMYSMGIDERFSLLNWVLPVHYLTRTVLDTKNKMNIKLIADKHGIYNEYEYFPFNIPAKFKFNDPLDLESEIKTIPINSRLKFNNEMNFSIGKRVLLPQADRFYMTDQKQCNYKGHQLYLTITDDIRRCKICHFSFKIKSQIRRIREGTKRFLELNFLKNITSFR